MSFVNRPLPYRDGYRMAPNCLLRSSLCSAIPPWRAKLRGNDGMHRIVTTKDASALQSHGDCIDQADFDVLLLIYAEFALCESLADTPIESIHVPLLGLLSAAGRQDGGKNRQWLRESLERLSTARICLDNEKAGIYLVNQALLESSALSKTDYEIRLPDEARQLFDHGFAGINWHQRQKLSPLGKWLHAFYSSHKRLPLRMGARLLGQLSGWSASSDSMNAAFPGVLEKELKLLAEVTGWRCEIDPESEQVIVVKQDDGVGGNAATLAKFDDCELGKADGEQEEI